MDQAVGEEGRKEAEQAANNLDSPNPQEKKDAEALTILEALVRARRATTRCSASSVACAAASRKSGEPVLILKYSTRQGAQSAFNSSGFMAGWGRRRCRR